MLRGNIHPQGTSHLTMVRQLGVGGFGSVYEAIDTRTGSHVAVKELDNTSPDAIARFKQEFRALAGIHHANLVGLKELIEHDGRWIIVMELVPGTDFLSYVRGADNDNGYDEARLRKALTGMVKGLQALHDNDLLHRDLKPSNVRVRPDGAAVLLDFGLATSVDPGRQSTHAAPIGTIAYMAPEQAIGRDIGPPADLYALGVCLFEALTGSLPFDGPQPLTILLAKQELPAPRASSMGVVPPDLDALCAALLATKPADRPTADAVLRTLHATDTRFPTVSERPRAPGRREVFTGREGELALLEQALARTHQGELRVVLIEGESGVGKSALAMEFVRRAQAAHGDTVVLRGRCYENEQVSYKAFDGCVDELARVLKHLPTERCSALLPVRAALLGQLFPVLRHVKPIAWARADDSSAEPTARRLEAFAAFAGLLANLAEQREVVLVIDDLQWADAESFRLLTALTEQPTLPPILIVASVRPRVELEADVLAQIEQVRSWAHTDVLPIVGLPREQARKLAAELLGPNAPERWHDLIAEESHGHPLFMSELVQYTRGHDFGSQLKLTLEAALRARINGLARPARELLEIVALAARPYRANIFAAALGVESIDEPARALLAARFLFERKGHELGCYHDRIRHTAVDLIARTRLPILHRKLAIALVEAPGGDPAEQARHWDLAGDREHALTAYEWSVAHAIETLAFRRAAQLSARALELVDDPYGARAQALMTQRARALVFAGYPAEAAELYERTAERAEGEQRLRLRASAAQALLISSNVARGLATASAVLREAGFFVPKGALSMLLHGAYSALALSVRRRLSRARRAAGTNDHQKLALEILKQVRFEASMAQPLLFPALTYQGARLAMRGGSTTEMATYYAGLGWLRAATRSLAAAVPFFTWSRSLLEHGGTPEASAYLAFSEGSARLTGFDWMGARAHLEQAHEICQQKLSSSPSLLTAIRYHLGIVWSETRAFALHARQLEAWILEARERNDTYALALLVGHGRGFMRHLMRDDPRAAHAELDDVMRPIPSAPFSFAHFGYLLGKVITYLYEGSPEALRFLDAYHAEHRDAFILRSRMGEEFRLMFRGFALTQSLHGTSPNLEREIAGQVRTIERALVRRRSPLARGIGFAFAAQRTARRGNPAKALAFARIARQLVDGDNDTPSAFSALIGVIEGGPAGKAAVDAAIRYYEEQGFRDPARALGVFGLWAGEDPPGGRPRSRPLGRYEVTGQLGSGGFGNVVSARDAETGRVVALKELVRGGTTSLERFKREFRALSSLHHANLVELEALFEHEERWYIAMELVEGEALLAYVRESGRCDAARLVASFRGLARALRFLHEHDFVHRDVTPGNVVVDREGRAVLVDFGHIARRGDRADTAGVGSPEYAAPEQLRGAAADPRADVYALGVCMYQAMTGSHPFGEGTPAELVGRKERGLRGGLPDSLPPELAALGTLCERMLAVAPEARPALEEVLAALEHERAPGSDEALSPQLEGADAAIPEAPFTGRDEELAWLRDMSERCCDEGLTIALIEGESGLGKSALAREFTRRSAGDNPLVWLLESRCYENEQIAFKAFDGIVDQLAQRLRALPNPVCEVLLPRHAALLPQLFPVLSSVPAIAGASRKGLPAEPAARKAAARRALLELLEQLCERVELMLVLDDLQWADPDSFELLQALCERARTLPILVVATLRPPRELAPELTARMAGLRAFEGTRTLRMAPLGAEATSRLAAEFGVVGEVAQVLARESHGHPLFLRELVEHEKRGLGGDTRGRTLDAALATRIDSLSADARALLSLVAIGDKPYGTHVYARALGLADLPREALIGLLGHGLLQRRRDGTLACAHDRIRGIALVLTDQDAFVARARKLAEALSLEPRADPSERARLWEDAHERERAGAAYEEAGERALEALAFTRAEQHFSRALSLLGEGGDASRAHRLLVARGHALARAGRSAEAARTFQEAARTAAGEQATRLRIWVAQHLIQSGQVTEGVSAATTLLKELGVSVPDGERGALLRIGWERARVNLRAEVLKPRALSGAEQLELEALHGLTAPLSLVSYLTGSTVMVQYLRRALDAGDPSHAARALGLEALWRTMRSPTSYDPALFERAHKLAQRTGDPSVEGHVQYVQGVACLARTEYGEAARHLGAANEIVHARCPGQPWLLNNIRMQLGFAWWTSGEFTSIRHFGGAWLEEARARDDRCAVAALAGYGGAALRHLYDGQPEAGFDEVDRAMVAWPDEPFSTIQFGAFCARTLLHAVSPPGPRFAAFIEALAPQARRAFLMRTPSARAAWLSFHAWAHLHRLQSPRDPARAEVTAIARKNARELGRIRTAIAAVTLRWLEAMIELLEGRRDEALRKLEEIARTSKYDGFCGQLPAEYACCLLAGGDAGRAGREALLASLRERGWRDPEIALAVRSPGLHLLA